MQRREIVLDSELFQQPLELSRIVVHELFHFVWRRMGNGTRRSFEVLLEQEMLRGARGELGWSAEWRKLALASKDHRDRSRRWREYVCESFCDSAAWFFCGRVRHAEHTLAPLFRRRRHEWFLRSVARTGLSV
jgi:hypothetical protein